MKLYYQTYFKQADSDGGSEHHELSPVLIIPGLFGSTANWRGFAKKLAEHRGVIVVDQRNHGQSPHAPENSFYDLVDDLLELIDDLEIDKVTLCGHSMGGKTAMMFALTHSSRVDKLMVLDIAPVQYSHSHAPILQALKSLDLSQFDSRTAIEQALSSSIEDKSTRLFIMLSLTGRAGEFRWRLNVDALLENLPFISGFPDLSNNNVSYSDSCLFLKGGNSDYVTEAHYPRIKELFPGAVISTVEQAGHWLHVDQQRAVLEYVIDF